jgi:hypothetical protein
MKKFKSMSIKPELKEQLAEYLKRIKDATTPTELAHIIWTKQLDGIMDCDYDLYRKTFIGWVWAYRDNTIPKEWTRYKTPEELAETVWDLNFDRSEEDKFLYGSLRSGLVEWINGYCGRFSDE